MENKFYKVYDNRGSYNCIGVYNPVTNDYKSICVYDWDDVRVEQDDDIICGQKRSYWRYCDINKEVARIYAHSRNVLCEDDEVIVVRGRTLEKGFIGTIKNFYDYKDKYGRWQATYIKFTDGNKININNVELYRIH